MSSGQKQSYPVPRLSVPLMYQRPTSEEACAPPVIVDDVSLGWIFLETSVEFLAFNTAIIDSNCFFCFFYLKGQVFSSGLYCLICFYSHTTVYGMSFDFGSRGLTIVW